MPPALHCPVQSLRPRLSSPRLSRAGSQLPAGLGDPERGTVAPRPPYQNGSPNTLNGPPTSGAWNIGDFWRNQNGAEFVCTVAGTPGTRRQIAPATVIANPSSGTFPTGCLILNVTDGGLERHGGSLSWEVQVAAGISSKFGFHGAAPTAQRSNANQAAATDLASVITLANELRAALGEKG